MNNKLNYCPRPKFLYKKKISKKLIEKFNYKSVMQVPKLKKIVINQGINISDNKTINNAINNITAITGQKAVYCLSKRDESGFKLRKGIPISIKVTLRRDIMYEFLDRLINIALPRVRDFVGVNKNSFDGKGNYNLGISEQIIFPEINTDSLKNHFGMNITFVTSSKNNKEAKYLLYLFGLPFKTKKNV
ncbi:LSU ribosomal protein L5p (L11e) [Candidatus Karelsulcia muelleri]|uniref:Large ribosomal subunit protein uL5 n=1 Tax=Candidatus Karelsulcia muelleri TaxID=336810 RepID=A0A654M2X8_9FLAO|nr:50S ribosomal protein L5 [Candidatus Karelsulcia muelleri]AGS33455.1 50S ribosomal protein L5 (L11e) [Candidatus Karelsulcia muelleri str. Sulcia-ALF]ALP70195.1 LSU ribosomal protein L5p (L11e) [Candidatus Karelsulcia muelleri]QND78441.1 LSU ribosomal protein L5 [Candidatus Karelsulcia muelleri]